MFQVDPSLREKLLAEIEQSPRARQERDAHKLLESLVHMYAGGNQRYLNYYGPPRTLITLPFYRVLSEEERGRLDFRNKAVFVGLSESSVTDKDDSYYTAFSRSDGVYLSGVEIAATAFANLLDGTEVKPVATLYFIVILLIAGMAIGLVCRLAGTVVAGIGVLTLMVLYLAYAQYRFAADGTWMPIVVPLWIQAPIGFLSALFWNYFESNRERQNIRRALAYYLPNDVVHEVADNIVDIRRTGETVYGICLYADAAGYTTLSETIGPQELSDFMHRYFEAIFAPLKQHGGLVVDLKGDSILAVWKSARPDDALRRTACDAALDLARAVNQFNRRSPSLSLPTRIGVHAGPIFLGNIGAGEHYMYGPTGDTVNTASRMDGLNKYLSTEILVSDEVIQGLDGFLTRELGAFRLKGKSRPVVVHELICRIEECEPIQLKNGALFADALRSLRRRCWDDAIEKFSRITRLYGEDGPANFYLALCEEYKRNTPGETWDGIVPLEEK
jgi:adenylate cyclase